MDLHDILRRRDPSSQERRHDFFEETLFLTLRSRRQSTSKRLSNALHRSSRSRLIILRPY